MRAGYPTGAPLVERYFAEWLIRQQNVSANTIASYRDTFRLLFKFAKESLRKAPSALFLDELDAPVIGAFLTDLELERCMRLRISSLTARSLARSRLALVRRSTMNLPARVLPSNA